MLALLPIYDVHISLRLSLGEINVYIFPHVGTNSRLPAKKVRLMIVSFRKLFVTGAHTHLVSGSPTTITSFLELDDISE